jgi:Protein of unknown function (DUF1638)
VDAKLISCRVMLEEVKPFLGPNVAVETFDIALHARPDVLRTTLQRAIDASDGAYDPIFLGYGMCSRALVGLVARRSRLVFPKADDCIEIFLGSRLRRVQEVENEPGTYFLTRGYLADGATVFAEHDRVVSRYGRDRGERLFARLIAHYKRLVYIRMPRVPTLAADRAHARAMAARHGMAYVELEGTPELMGRMVTGDWRHDIVLVPPGQRVTLESFR